MFEPTVKELFLALRRDTWRRTNDFSEDIRVINAILDDPYVNEDDIYEGMRNWFAKKQPCIFGRAAARTGSIFLCILRDEHIYEGDEAIRELIARGQRTWKQQALAYPPRQETPHSFVLLIASKRVAFAEPDDHLYRFSSRIWDLAGWGSQAASHDNPVATDYLYLRSPHDARVYGFRYNVDFFASAGDGRWWHDHRIPGGIAFTANSPGHMFRFQEWYPRAKQEETDRGEWFIRAAMTTVSMAHPTLISPPPTNNPLPVDPIAEGRVTWLRELQGGRPHKRDCPCPFKNTPPARIEGKDWTAYEGHLHTDHSVRVEFFAGRDKPPTARTPYLMDLTYLFDRSEKDHAEFMQGVPFTDEQVYEKVGTPDTWMGPYARIRPATAPGGPGESSPHIDELLDICDRWPEDSGLDPGFYDT
jgi:hypothetical protein